jgi:hypothetical protein
VKASFLLESDFVDKESESTMLLTFLGLGCNTGFVFDWNWVLQIFGFSFVEKESENTMLMTLFRVWMQS